MTYLIGIYNHETGENIVREMTDEEKTQYEQENAEYAIEASKKLEKNQEEKAIKISAYKKLGLSDEEIEALLPTPKLVNRDSGTIS